MWQDRARTLSEIARFSRRDAEVYPAYEDQIERISQAKIDAAGEREPVRVTYSDGFDGLPVFSPDGKKLIFSSSVRSKSNYEFNIFYNRIF